jgi:hypothetical protein
MLHVRWVPSKESLIQVMSSWNWYMGELFFFFWNSNFRSSTLAISTHVSRIIYLFIYLFLKFSFQQMQYS